MRHVNVDEVESAGPTNATRLTDALDAENLAVNYYDLAPGERFSGGMHTHLDQEELFVVTEGEATFETPEDDHVVSAGEAIRFAPGEYQTGVNDGDEPVRAYALGAPRDSEEVRVPQKCSNCGHGSMAFVNADEGPRLECPDCGTRVEVPE